MGQSLTRIRARPVAFVQPLRDRAAVVGLPGGDDHRVSHQIQRNRAAEVLGDHLGDTTAGFPQMGRFLSLSSRLLPESEERETRIPGEGHDPVDDPRIEVFVLGVNPLLQGLDLGL